MVKETVQSIKAEIQAELHHLRDELKAKHGDSHNSLKEATNPSSVFLSESHNEFRKYVEDKMDFIESSIKTLSSTFENISTSIDQLQDYSHYYNVKLGGVPELKAREIRPKHHRSVCNFLMQWELMYSFTILILPIELLNETWLMVDLSR